MCGRLAGFVEVVFTAEVKECANIDLLESDEGLSRVARSAEKYGLSRQERRELDRRLRKGRGRTFPSPTRLYEYLNEFHNESEEKKRIVDKAFIPEANEYLRGLREVNAESQLELPFATVVYAGKAYRVKGIATNPEGEGFGNHPVALREMREKRRGAFRDEE